MKSSAYMGLIRRSISHPLPPFPSFHMPPLTAGCNVESAEAGEGEQVCAVMRRAALCDSARVGGLSWGRLCKNFLLCCGRDMQWIHGVLHPDVSQLLLSACCYLFFSTIRLSRVQRAGYWSAKQGRLFMPLQRHRQQAGRCVGSHSVLHGLWLQMTTGTSAAKIAVNGQIAVESEEVQADTCSHLQEDAESLAFSPLTRVLWVTVRQAVFLCWLWGRKVNRAKLLLPAVSDHSGCISAVVGACWERGSSCTVTSLLQCLSIINACQLVGGCQWEGSPDSAVEAQCADRRGVLVYI